MFIQILTWLEANIKLSLQHESKIMQDSNKTIVLYNINTFVFNTDLTSSNCDFHMSVAKLLYRLIPQLYKFQQI